MGNNKLIQHCVLQEYQVNKYNAVNIWKPKEQYDFWLVLNSCMSYCLMKYVFKIKKLSASHKKAILACIRQVYDHVEIRVTIKI